MAVDEVNAVSYLRVSGDSQISGDGFPRQREIIQKYAATNNVQILNEFRDEGVPGKMELEGRAGLSACIQFVRENKIQLVVIEDATRLARDMIISEVVIREFQKIGVHVISASGGIDLTEGDDSNPTAKLIRQILAAVSEFERCVIVLKLRGARQRKKAKTGKGEGRHSYGEKPEEVSILDMILDLRKAGETSRNIATILTDRGHLTRYKLPWNTSTVAKIIARELRKRKTA